MGRNWGPWKKSLIFRRSADNGNKTFCRNVIKRSTERSCKAGVNNNAYTFISNLDTVQVTTNDDRFETKYPAFGRSTFLYKSPSHVRKLIQLLPGRAMNRNIVLQIQIVRGAVHTLSEIIDAQYLPCAALIWGQVSGKSQPSRAHGGTDWRPGAKSTRSRPAGREHFASLKIRRMQLIIMIAGRNL